MKHTLNVLFYMQNLTGHKKKVTREGSDGETKEFRSAWYSCWPTRKEAGTSNKCSINAHVLATGAHKEKLNTNQEKKKAMWNNFSINMNSRSETRLGLLAP